MKILIIEDEYNLADAIKGVLESQKYLVQIALDGKKGLEEALYGNYDLIILDVMLPFVDGFTILKEIKSKKINSKVIMLTSKSTIEDKMEGFKSGANDYLTKPFHMDELLARINLQLERNASDGKISFEDLILDTKTLQMVNANTNQSIDIIGKEFQVLEMLLHNSKNIISKEQIFEKIWGYDSDADINIIEAYISFIRKKIKLLNVNIKISAVRNMGYKLEVKDEEIKD